MNLKTVHAKDILAKGNYTCVLYDGERLFVDTKRGVAPLLSFLESKESFAGFSAADKVVGAGAAYLYVLLGIRELYAEVISENAKKIILAHGISLFYGQSVPFIKNRAGNGTCPIELAVAEAKDAEDALGLIKAKLKQLNTTSEAK